MSNNGATPRQLNTIKVNANLGSIAASVAAIKLYDFAYRPEHPKAWIGVLSRDLEESELFEVQSWLRLMASSAYDTITHYTPAMRILAYFERGQDAAMFKLVWGGE